VTLRSRDSLFVAAAATTQFLMNECGLINVAKIKMKKNIIYIPLIILLTIGCAPKKIILKKEVINSSNSLSLDAYESSDGTNRIKSIMNSKEPTKINLDGKEYDIDLFKSIVDTIKGEYSINIDNNKKIVRIIRMRY
jgi:hypothetical protein